MPQAEWMPGHAAELVFLALDAFDALRPGQAPLPHLLRFCGRSLDEIAGEIAERGAPWVPMTLSLHAGRWRVDPHNEKHAEINWWCV